MNSATMLGKTCGHPATAMASTRRPCPAPAPVAFVPKASFAHQVTSISQRRTEIATRAAPASQASAAATTPVNPYEGKPEWYALVARAEFFFNDVQNEALAEQLRELKRYYEENGRQLDFFFVSEPAWLANFPEAKAVKRPAVALVSTDKQWITFMKLRLDRVLKLEIGSMAIDDATKSTAPVPEFKPIDSEKWTAPYAPYAAGWWEVFMRK